MYKLSVFCLLMCLLNTMGQFYEDKRCLCVCPSPEVMFDSSAPAIRRSYIDAKLPPAECNCFAVVVPRLGAAIASKESQYCKLCECKFQTRNTTVILVVVVIVLCSVVVLGGYAGVLCLLAPLLRPRHFRTRARVSSPPPRHREEVVSLLAAQDSDHEHCYSAI